jgi:hypothetical protein
MSSRPQYYMLDDHRTGLPVMTKKELLDVVRLYNAEKRLPITFRMPQADIIKYLLTDKGIDHVLLAKAFRQIAQVASKRVPDEKGSKLLVPAIVKKSQPKKTNTKPSLQPDISVKGRGRGRPAGSKNRFRPEFANQSVPTLKVIQ